MQEPITDVAIVEGYNQDALGMRGRPDGLFRVGDAREVREILSWAHHARQPITPVGLRSATTGSPVAPYGYLLSTENLQTMGEVDPQCGEISVAPGVNLGELKRFVSETGWFFPPDPTSENECTVGGAVATNASGARTLQYGSIRRWINALDVVLPDGESITLKRVRADKSAAGYFGFQDPMQFFIGSEGTLGVITRVVLQCIPLPADDISMYAFFPDEATTLRAVATIRKAGWPVRCLEYFDRACLDLLRKEKQVALPEADGGLLFFEEEIALPDSVDQCLERWIPRLEALGAFPDATMVGDTRARKTEMKAWRHDIPSLLNERGIRYRLNGGRKISTDWAVSVADAPHVVHICRQIAEHHGVDEVYCFGHLGNGHPHFNLLAPDAARLSNAEAAVWEMCQRVGEYGGTVSAEHGVGKVKKKYLPLFYPPIVLKWMQSFKHMVDPHGIMSPGNLFD